MVRHAQADLPMKITARALAEKLHGELEGDGEVQISDVACISQAGPSDVTFAESAHSCSEAFASAAGVILVRRCAPTSGKTLIRVENCREAFAQAMTIFHAPKEYEAGIDPSARLSDGVRLGSGVFIGANAVLGVGVTVGDRTVISAHCVVGEGSSLGADCLLHASVTIYSQVKIGNRFIAHSGTVIGSDGFGYTRKAAGIVKIPQIGNVIIEDDVELGANVTIDRATLNSTIIGAGTKIDNQVQVAHNVIIGRNCLIAGMTGIGGSARLGDGVTLAGGVSVVDHVEIGANAVVGAVSLVTKNVPPGQVVWGSPARRARDAKRETAALGRLPDLLRTLHTHPLAATNGHSNVDLPANGD